MSKLFYTKVCAGSNPAGVTPCPQPHLMFKKVTVVTFLFFFLMYQHFRNLQVYTLIEMNTLLSFLV